MHVFLYRKTKEVNMKLKISVQYLMSSQGELIKNDTNEVNLSKSIQQKKRKLKVIK